VSKPAARKPTVMVSGYETSLVRCVIVVLLVLAGIAWITVYTQVAMDAANYVKLPGVKKPDNPLPWMADLKKWNYAIGFGLAFVGLVVAAHKKTPLGRGRGVVVGMLGCFLIGLVWIITYYFVGQDASVHIPVMDQLQQWNLVVGVGFMGVGFSYATKWE
jgi:drug/metabolite transporter (DMT)-like permease